MAAMPPAAALGRRRCALVTPDALALLDAGRGGAAEGAILASLAAELAPTLDSTTVGALRGRGWLADCC